MFEKLKDFLYDCSDTLLSIFIILIMTLVIAWKLSGAMSIPLLDNINTSSKKIIAETHENIEINDTDKKTTDNTEANKTESSDNEANITAENNNNTEKNNDNMTMDDTSSDSNNNEIEVIHLEAVTMTIEIPKGTTGVGIAKILKEKGLIRSTTDFINRVEELKLAPKLRFGTFKIKSDSSIDDIIYILTGTSKAN